MRGPIPHVSQKQGFNNSFYVVRTVDMPIETMPTNLATVIGQAMTFVRAMARRALYGR